MDLNIRNVDDALVRELKACALEKGITLREVCITVLAAYAGPMQISREIRSGIVTLPVSRGVIEPDVIGTDVYRVSNSGEATLIGSTKNSTFTDRVYEKDEYSQED